MNNLLPGISVVIPSFVADAAEMTGDIAATNLGSALSSLAEQSLRKDLIEVLIILNGKGAAAASGEAMQIALHDSLASRFPELSIRVMRSLAPGAGRARNLGISSASRRFITFLDDDDTLQPRYLETGLENADDGAITLLPIVNTTDGASTKDNFLNARITTLHGTAVPVATAPWALGFNASKIIPTALAQRYRYDESLRSGEDVAYFANFLRTPGLLLHTPKAGEETAYVRSIRPDSVSRQRESFDFNVVQRLECIAKLRDIEEADTKPRALEKLEQAQFGFVENYLTAHPSECNAQLTPP
ncbi:glycosyltransferase family 2 protein [Corynebacterium hiratae]|uniref:Glycosyltransferase family 2 protein n=1 Tax=Corynebacterium hiratae TaxID=3139423 RepID=A0A553FXE6_9CORY|nr:glycosyltransferase family A protein [Corynebacterium aurimucosum]TRX61928.1 glycosyltransferase family 2 protein [Corynebacterium aurimucosum]